jgi:hypothetical protein
MICLVFKSQSNYKFCQFSAITNIMDAVLQLAIIQLVALNGELISIAILDSILSHFCPPHIWPCGSRTHQFNMPIPNPAIGHNSKPVPPTFLPHNLSPWDLQYLTFSCHLTLDCYCPRCFHFKLCYVFLSLLYSSHCPACCRFLSFATLRLISDLHKSCGT